MKLLMLFITIILAFSCGYEHDHNRNTSGRNKPYVPYYECSKDSYLTGCTNNLSSRKLRAFELFGYQCRREYNACLYGDDYQYSKNDYSQELQKEMPWIVANVL